MISVFLIDYPDCNKCESEEVYRQTACNPLASDICDLCSNKFRDGIVGVNCGRCWSAYFHPVENYVERTTTCLGLNTYQSHM